MSEAPLSGAKRILSYWGEGIPEGLPEVSEDNLSNPKTLADEGKFGGNKPALRKSFYFLNHQPLSRKADYRNGW